MKPRLLPQTDYRLNMIVVASMKCGYSSFEMAQVRPEDMGVSEQVTFKIPVDDGSEMILMLPSKYAERLIAKADAAEMGINEFLLEMVNRGLKDPTIPLKIVNFVGVNFGTVRFPPKNENPEAK
jgi:hypothetical protein